MAVEWQMNTSSAETGVFAEVSTEGAQNVLPSALHAEVYQFQVSGTQPRTDNSAEQKPDASAEHKPYAHAEQTGATPTDADPAVVRQQLEAALTEKFPREKERVSLITLMNTFEQRATNTALSSTSTTLTPRQVAQTYLEILRLLSPNERAGSTMGSPGSTTGSPGSTTGSTGSTTGSTGSTTEASSVPLEKRIQLAQQVLHHAANPNSIDQGRHNTCIASSLEVRAYTRAPERAAKVIADIALNNSFSTTDGTKISLDPSSLISDEESKPALPNNGERDYASQLFAVVANNVYWLRSTEGVLNSKPVEPGTFRYAQIPELRRNTYKQGENGQVERIFDFGERVIDMRSKPYNWVSEKPSVPAERIEEIYAQITGDTAGGFVITAKNKSLQVPNPVESAQQLKERVISLKERGLLPAILVVNTNNSPWNDYPGIWHAVNIIDYNAKKDQLAMSDQYGKDSDKNMKAYDLYKAASGPSGLPPPTFPPFTTRMPTGFPQGARQPGGNKP